MFDFEWANQQLFYGAYTRSSSYFSNSTLAASDLPRGKELALLNRWRDQLPPALFNQPFRLPHYDGSGFNRDAIRQALQLLEQAGWVVRNGQLQQVDTGQPFRFEILLSNPAFERVSEPFANNLRKIGVLASIRTVDSAQYQNRMQHFDFDMTVEGWGQSLSPGNEQRNYWSSAAADQPGSRNSIGIKSPVIDALVDEIIKANSLEDLTPPPAPWIVCCCGAITLSRTGTCPPFGWPIGTNLTAPPSAQPMAWAFPTPGGRSRLNSYLTTLAKSLLFAQLARGPWWGLKRGWQEQSLYL